MIRLTREITAVATNEQLEMALLQLRCLVDCTEEQAHNLKMIQEEIADRLGQPAGELHLSVLSGERGKIDDFSLNTH